MRHTLGGCANVHRLTLLAPCTVVHNKAGSIELRRAAENDLMQYGKSGLPPDEPRQVFVWAMYEHSKSCSRVSTRLLDD